MSDASGVLDTRSALQRDLLAVPDAAAPLPAFVVLQIEGARIECPYEREAIATLVENAYRIAGYAAVSALHEAAVRSHDSFLRAAELQEAGLHGDLARLEQEVARSRQSIAEYGADQPAQRQALAERQQVRALYSRPTAEALARLRTERERRDALLRGLREAADQVAQMEEEAQRWYESRLMAVIEADFARQAERLRRDWTRYDIRRAADGERIGWDAAQDAAGLVIAATDDMKDVEVGAAGLDQAGVPRRIQQGAARQRVPAVVQATDEVARAQMAYRQALEQGRVARGFAVGSAPEPVDPRLLSGYDERRRYARLLQEHGAAHPIVFAAHRKLYTRSVDLAFNRQSVEQAVIAAFIGARDSLQELLRDMRDGRLFVDEARAALVGRPALAVPAAERLIDQRYGDGPPVATQDAANQNRRRPSIYRSPWLQRPFHERIKALADLLRAEAEGAAERAAEGAAEGDAGGAAEDGASDAVAAEPPARREQRAQHLDHLRPIFGEPADREMLLWVTGIGTLAERARLEAVGRLQGHVDQQDRLRRQVQIGVGVAGLLTAPFSGGKSLVLAGLIDAALVADRSTEEIVRWVAAKQFSAIALDQLAAAHWTEPEVAELVGQLLEAGFEIAADLLQTGAVGRVFDAIGVAQLLSSAVPVERGT